MGGRVMDEYIEREALMRRIKEIHCAECDSYHGVRCRACWVDDTLDYIDSEPAADVTPVRHGRWMNANSRPKTYWRRCTACGGLAYFCGIGCSYKYCPNCGADMRGSNDE